MRLSTADKVNTGFAIALGIVLIIGISSIASIQRFLTASGEMGRTNSALLDLHGVLVRLVDAESAQRGYVLTGDESYLQPFTVALAAVPEELARLRRAAGDDTAQQRRLASLEALAARRLDIMADVVRARRDATPDAATAIIAAGHGKEAMDSIRTVAHEVQQAELQRLAARNSSAEARARLALAIIASGSIFAFLVVLSATVLIRRDYTERRRAEQALRDSETLLSQFMENLPIGVLVIDAEWQPRFTNHAAVQILGMSVLVDLEHSPLTLLRAADGAAYPREEWPLSRALAGHTTTIDDAAAYVDGRTVPLQISAAPIYDASGRIAYAIATFSDITDHRHTESALRAAKEAAEDANRTKSEFLARMSHELRTPLNSVIGFANVLLRNRAGNLREQDTAYLQRILENGKHLLLLINDILDLAKIEAGKIVLERRPTDLGELVQAVTAQFEDQLRSPAVALRVSVPDVVEPVTTDPDRLRQVLLNLVGNAVKFTEQGEVVVAVETGDDGQQPVRIRVRDTGIGIPEDRLHAIFDAFEQAESTTSRKYGGTGLGLPISRALCELLGYGLEVRSTPGQGSEFVIRLEPPAGAAEHAAGGPSRRRRLVLIVDDDDDARALLGQHVEELGCQAVHANSGASALRLARELHPDLITLDLRMPGMDGWELIERLKQDPAVAHIPIVVVSVIAEENRASLLGAIDVLQKPVERAALHAALRRNLAVPRAARVLVIDDAPDARRLLVDMLADRAAEIRTAENGQAAIALLRTFEPELVITDLLMPVMDGMTFLEVFRRTERFRHVPVIVVTARDLTPADRARLERHTTAVLQKGSALEADLRRVLATVLGGPPATAAANGAA